MLRLGVGDIAGVTGASVLLAGGYEVAGEVAIDSRAVRPGALFVAFSGARANGNDYLGAAVAAGAACVVATAEPAAELLGAARAAGCAVLRAEGDDGGAFLMRLASAWRERHPEWLVVGVTGSVGKTTTKDMLRAAFGSQRRTFATRGNLNNLLGLPLTILSVPEGCEVVVCEMGMEFSGEIGRMAACARPALACITNVGTSHVGNVGSREGIARAKAEIVSGMRPAAGVTCALALTSANDYTDFIAREFARPAGIDVLLCGEGADDDVRATNVVTEGDGTTSLTLATRSWEGRVHVGVPGRQAVPDFLLAMALAERAGLDVGAAALACSDMERTGARLELARSAGGLTVVDDTYNASPSSMAAALDVLRELPCEGRRVAVLGEMAELGGDAAELHALVGAYAAATAPDLLVCVGGALASRVAEAALLVGFPANRVLRAADVAEALALLRGLVRPGDVVLAKASHAAGLDRLVKGVLDL